MKINNSSPDEHEYTKLLVDIADSPKRLWYIGSLPETRMPTVAIVGTRKPTPYGRDIAHRFATELASHGIIIVSGLALGMDAVAHRAALQAGGRTIAVMAGGLDRIHPPSHRNLAIDILHQRGALISEYPPGSVPYLGNFIARNRIVSGLSDGVLIIEASAKSGTMHTATFALDQGRAVMAVPGNITSPMSAGCNNLLARGARLVASSDDVLEELGLQPINRQSVLPLSSSPQEQAILALLQQGTADGDAIQKQSGLTPALYSQTMTMLEITGKIRALGANKWGMGR